MLQSSIVVAVVFDVGDDGAVTFHAINPHGQAVAGVDPLRCAGRPLADILPGDAERLAARLLACAADRRTMVVEERLAFPAAAGWWEMELTPLAEAVDDDDGPVRQVLLTAVDVTARKQEVLRVRGSEPRLQDVFDTPLTAVVSMDADQRIVLFNRGAQALFGYAEEEVLGRPVDMLLPDRFREPHRRVVEHYADSPLGPRLKDVPREIIGLAKDGTEIPLEGAVSKHIGPEGLRLTAVLLDARRNQVAQRTLAARNRMLAAIAANLQGVFLRRVSDRLGRLRFDYVSSGAADLFGFPPEALMLAPERIHMGVHRDDRTLYREAVDASQRTLGPIDVEFRVTPPGRGERWVHAVSRPLRTDAGEIVWDEVIMDVTDRRRAEQALVRSEERARALMSEADRANRAKSEFLADMSHELRTPLNAILGFAQLLLLPGAADAPLSERQKSYAESILKGGHHLLSLVGDILELAKIEAGQVRIETAALPAAEIVEEVAAHLRPLGADAAIAIRVEPPAAGEPRVRADRTRLLQVLMNLGSNAVKYNRPGGSVTLVVSRPQPGRLRFAVHDTGHGIPTERQQELFQPFNRLGAERGSVEGTGIGLTLSKRLVEMMQGTIGFTSTPGVGSVFWVDFPAQESTVSWQGSSDDTPLALTSLGPFTLLYVEDNPTNMAVMAALFEHLPDARLLEATTAERGLELARSCQPDVIVIDIGLPGMDGFTALACLRTQTETRHIPVIALSADAMPAALDRGMSAGFRAWLTKPLQFEGLLATLETVLAER